MGSITLGIVQLNYNITYTICQLQLHEAEPTKRGTNRQ